MGIEAGDQVTFEYVGRLTDDTVFDTSYESVAEESGLADAQPDRNYSPLTVEIGTGQIINGLEDELLGLQEGDTETVTVPPEHAYGEPSDDQIQAIDRNEFEQMLQDEEPDKGMMIQTQQGEVGEVVHVGEDNVHVDFNHELAGETLVFDVEIVDVS